MPYDAAALFGTPTKRVDGPAKVTGAARYASDEPVAHPAFAYLVISSIARGRVLAFDLAASRAVPGLLDILTHENVGKLAEPPPPFDKGQPVTTLESDRVWHDGQIVAVVVAETYEAAREAANKVRVHYEEEVPSAGFGSAGITENKATPMFAGPPPCKGDADAALARAPVTLEAEYQTPTQHHNPIELFTTTCVWDGPRLTIHEPTQFVWGTRATVARQLGMSPDDVRVVSRFVGGAFGSKGPNARTAWVAIAARRLGRAVKLVATRDQGFSIAAYRAETRQRIRLGAETDGRLTALIQEGWELTSRPSEYNVAGVESTARMYACPNIRTAVRVVHADRNTPGFMRAPPEVPYMFALESAMDELAWTLGMDPVELRRVNDTRTDPVSGLPFSSRSLMECFDQAAERFGWASRRRDACAMTDGEWQVGYGCATACYPSNIGPASARLTLTPGGRASIGIAGHEIGTGAYTVAAIAVAHSLGLAVGDVDVRMGDSELPPLVIAGGSSNAASIVHVAVKACEEARRRIAAAAVAASGSPLHGADADSLQLKDGQLVGPGNKREALRDALSRLGGRVEVYAEFVPDGMPAEAMSKLYQGGVTLGSGTSRKDVTAFAFGAHFVEVRVHGRTREMRVPRVVSAFAGGTIINPVAARSQYLGGAIWGLSSALHEETEIDRRAARYVNDNLADYLMPVCADVPSVEIIMVPEKDDRVNPLGVKGIGELGIVGMNAAVANAVFHATGQRIRELPLRLEKLL